MQFVFVEFSKVLLEEQCVLQSSIMLIKEDYNLENTQLEI